MSLLSYMSLHVFFYLYRIFFFHMTYFQVESELAGLGQEDRDMFLEDMGVTDEECGLHVSTETDCMRGYLFYSIIEEKRRDVKRRDEERRINLLVTDKHRTVQEDTKERLSVWKIVIIMTIVPLLNCIIFYLSFPFHRCEYFVSVNSQFCSYK